MGNMRLAPINACSVGGDKPIVRYATLGAHMKVRREKQINAVVDDVLALTAVVGPILAGVLNALKADVVAEAGGTTEVKLKMLPRLYRPGDGDVVCAEARRRHRLAAGGTVARRAGRDADGARAPLAPATAMSASVLNMLFTKR